MMLDESEGYRAALETFMPTLQEITPVCDTTPQQHLLQLCVQNIRLMQQSVLDPLSHLQNLAAVRNIITISLSLHSKNVEHIAFTVIFTITFV